MLSSFVVVVVVAIVVFKQRLNDDVQLKKTWNFKFVVMPILYT